MYACTCVYTFLEPPFNLDYMYYMCLWLTTWDWTSFVGTSPWRRLVLSQQSLTIPHFPYSSCRGGTMCNFLSVFGFSSWCCHCGGNCIIQATVLWRVHWYSFPDRWRRQPFQSRRPGPPVPPPFWDFPRIILVEVGKSTVIYSSFWPILDLCNSLHLLQKVATLTCRNS